MPCGEPEGALRLENGVRHLVFGHARAELSRSGSVHLLDYFSQRIVEYWNGLSSDVVNASSANSFKGRLDRHRKEFMFSLELPKRTVTSCH